MRAGFDAIQKQMTPIRKMWESGQVWRFYGPDDWRYLWAHLHSVALRWAGAWPQDRANFWVLVTGMVHSSVRSV
jgi:hypothetical protein